MDKLEQELGKQGLRLVKCVHDGAIAGYETWTVSATHIKSGVTFHRHVRREHLKDCKTKLDEAKTVAKMVKAVVVSMGFEAADGS